MKMAPDLVEKVSLASTPGIDQWRFPLPLIDEADCAVRLDHYLRVVSEEEKILAGRCSDQGRADFIITRGTVREILAHYAGDDPAGLQFGHAPSGKPRLLHSDICFNVTHTGGLALLVVSLGREVGVDVERIRPVLWASRIAQRFFAARDAQSILEAPPLGRSEVFLRHWTLREALLKAAGPGLSALAGTRELVFGAPGGDAHFTCHFACRRWSLHSVVPARGYVGAIAGVAPESVA